MRKPAHGAASSGFKMPLDECSPEYLRQELGGGTLGARTHFVHSQTTLSSPGLNGFTLRRAEHKVEEALKHTAAPDASASGLTRCTKA